MTIAMKKTKVKMNKHVYLGMSILGISKTLMCEFWYDYIKWNYGHRAKLCYTDTGSFIIHVKTVYFYKDIANAVEKWFDTCNYDENDERPLPVDKNKKVLGLFKDKLGGKIMKVFVRVRVKTWAYLMDYESEKKKAKRTEKRIIKKDLMVKNYENCLFNDKIILKSQQAFRSDHHDVYTVEINKIALSSNDDKRLQTFDKITTCPHGTNAFKMWDDDSERLICWQLRRLLVLWWNDITTTTKINVIMINFDDYANENKTEHNQKWPYILDHWCRVLTILITGSSRIWQNKCIIEFNKLSARYWSKIFVYQRSVWR